MTLHIFEVFAATGNSAVPANEVWSRNLYEPLIDLGHDVHFESAADGLKALKSGSAEDRARFSERLVEAFRRSHRKRPFDLVFAYLYGGMVDAAAIDELRASGVPCVNFSCNNVHQFDIVRELAPHFDLNLHAERDVGPRFDAVGARAMWWPMASNPTHFKPVDVPRDVDVSFVGANYATRAAAIRHLLDNGIDVHAFGPKWTGLTRNALNAVLRTTWLGARALFGGPQHRARAADFKFRHAMGRLFPDNMHPPVTDAELIALYSRSRISLGFLDVYDRHDPSAPIVSHLHLREFEAPMCGALYLTGASDELAEAFEPDREVLVYSSHDELLDKVRHYLAHPDEGEAIRRAGSRRALAEHTYHRRFETLFDALGLD